MKTLHDALTTIYHHAEAHMPTEELESVASKMTAEAENVALNLSDIVGGLACLVSEDGTHKAGAGCFQDAESAFPLLWGLSQQFDHLAALIRIGGDARLEVHERMKRAAAPEQPKKGRAAS